MIDSALKQFNDSALRALLDSAQLPPADSLLKQRSDSARICFDTKNLLDSLLANNRVFRGAQVAYSDNHDGQTSSEIGYPERTVTHLDEDYLDSVYNGAQSNPSGWYKSFLELLLHEMLHGLNMHHPNDTTGYPYLTPPYPMLKNGNPPCVKP